MDRNRDMDIGQGHRHRQGHKEMDGLGQWQRQGTRTGTRIWKGKFTLDRDTGIDSDKEMDRLQQRKGQGLGQ